MGMFKSDTVDQHFPSAAEFYNGKNVFITGATGFVGAAILENLLRCFPGIKSIYILLRSKKNVAPEIRMQETFNKKLFEKLKEDMPEMLGKVHLIAGDTSQPNLGMNEDDVQMLIDEVAVVFHLAAAVSFTKPLEFMLNNNVQSLVTVIGLCRKMRKFEALVYTSTIFSNGNHLNLPLKEDIYRLPFRADRFIDALKKGDNAMLQELVAYCKPDWPNSYTFSKCLAENVILDIASDLPVAIVRPSIVVCTWKKPMPGYIEGNFGITALSVGAGKGFIKVAHADPNTKLNMVPADITANTHVLAAWGIGTKRCASPFVVNCTAPESLETEIGEYSKFMTEMVLEFPLPQSFDHHNKLIMVPNKYLYYIVALYYHYIPAIVLDGMLRILGKKTRVYSLYRFFDKANSAINFFIFRSFKYERQNMELLDKLIQTEERKDLSIDFSNLSFREMAFTLPEGSPFYDWTIDKRSGQERERIKQKRHILIKGSQWMFLLTCGLLIYWLFALIFF